MGGWVGVCMAMYGGRREEGRCACDRTVEPHRNQVDLLDIVDGSFSTFRPPTLISRPPAANVTPVLLTISPCVRSNPSPRIEVTYGGEYTGS